MATRYYPAVKAPGARIHGGVAGTWARQGVFGQTWDPVQWAWQLSQSKVNAGALQTRSARTNQQGNYDFFGWRLLTPPLEAQTISGTFDLCQMVQARWNTGAGFTSDSVVRYKVHVYITVGQSPTVRHVLLDNYLDSVNWTSTLTWRSLVAAQALTAGDAQAGDCVLIEIGARVVSSPTPAPTYPPTAFTECPIRGTGATNGAGTPFADATAGSVNASLAPWFEFSANLVEQAAPAPPANDACADALVIAALPHTSAEIDTSQSADTDRRAWWTWTAPSSGKVCFHTFGSNYGITIAAFTGGCGALAGVPSQIISNSLARHRSQSSVMFDAVGGTQYWIRVSNDNTGSSFNAPQGGGLCRLSGFYRTTDLQEDDLYLPAGNVLQLRSGAIINLNAGFAQSAPTGVAIDYTERVMDDLNGGTHAAPRLLVGLHNFDLVEIFDLLTLSYGSGQFEVDFIGTPWDAPGISQHPGQLVVTTAGLLYAGWFGDGYLFVAGAGGVPTILNTVSSLAAYAALKSIDATHGDNQAGAPYTDTLQFPTAEVTAPWAIALDEATGTLYYTSGGVYEPVGGAEIRTFNVNTNTQGPVFATLALQGTVNPGLKGLCVIPGGGLLVCNGPVVQRLNAAGAVIQTYTPSIPVDSQCLMDVKLTSDGLGFWVVDLATATLFHFLLDGTELAAVQTYQVPATLTQLALYQPDGITPPEPEPVPAPADFCPFPPPPDSGGGVACVTPMPLPPDSAGGGAQVTY